MKKSFFLLSFFVLIAFGSKAQLGASYHQSSTSFVGINYQFTERILPEIRVGVNSAGNNVWTEFDFNYLIVKKEDFQFYSGIGAKVFSPNGSIDGATVPVGLNIFPFEKKNFGFQAEVASIFNTAHFELRGSWGIRYIFN